MRSDHSPPVDAFDAAIERNRLALVEARESLPAAALTTAQALVTGTRSEAFALAESKIRHLEGNDRALRYRRTHEEYAQLDADVARREHHYAAEVERCSTLRARAANRDLREIGGGAGEAWRAAERDRKHNLDEAFAAYEALNLWLLSERRKIDALIEQRDTLSAQMAAILPN